MKKLAIFIPAYNEERAIGSVVLGAKKYGAVYVVDDGSDDRTAKIASAAGAKVYPHGKNLGYGAALRTILAVAKKTPADAFAVLDADGQHDPDEIPLVAGPVLSGKADVCSGSRFLGKTVASPAYRKEGVRLLNRLSTEQANGRKLDFQCGFRAFSRKAAEKIRIHEDGYAGGAEMLFSAIGAGLRIAEVPVTIHYYGKDGDAVEHGAGLLGYIVGGIAKRRPLLFFGGAGLASLLASALLGLFVLDTFYSKGALPVGSAFLTVFAGVVGLVLIVIGINLYTLQAILKMKGRGEI